MTGYERINCVLRKQPPDRIPVMLHNFMFAVRDCGLTQQQFRSSPETMCRVFVETSRKYSLDAILTDADTTLEAHALGAGIHEEEDLPAKVIKPVSERLDEVIDSITADKLNRDSRIRIYLDAIRLIRSQVGGELFIRGNADQGPFSLAAAVFGLTNMMTALTDKKREEPILRLIDRCYDVHLAFHRLVKDAGADITSFGDSMASPDLISPKMYRKFAAPFQKRLAEDLRKDGIQTVCHICGKTDAILEPWSEIGFAGVEIDYKTDIAKVKGLMQGRAVVFGVIDPSGVFCNGTAETVRSETSALLNLFQGKDIVPGSGCALPAETPPENIRAFTAAAAHWKSAE
ncbi:MAG: hypothetical protein LBT89_09580 [Planctomycetaceae bacterium]|nr:hypothetical protein [Planctomycetaceae bacterium]